MIKDAVLIAGPTASGKSSFALRQAETAKKAGRRPVIINTDSMQVYQELRLLSARPSVDDMTGVEHALYGFVPAAQAFNTGNWLQEVTKLCASLDEAVLPIFVGGTGLYFKALTDGFAIIPPVPSDIRDFFRHELLKNGAENLYKVLQHVDPLAAATIKPADGQRIVRALEVERASGQPISLWQAEAQSASLLNGVPCHKIIVLPERSLLYQRIDQRFDQMMLEGALEEVRALKALDLASDLPAMKAIGVPQLMEHIKGGLSLVAAVADAKQESRRYAKRQMTWLRNQMGKDWERVGI